MFCGVANEEENSDRPVRRDVRLNELVRSKRGVTADTALRLAQFFKTTLQFWMHMQANFDLKAPMVRRRALKLAKRP